jgi:ATP-dependent Clp protease ATP-binding subunit ClpC
MSKTETFLKSSGLYPAILLEHFFYVKRRLFLIKVSKYLLLSLPIIIIISIILSGYGFTMSNESANLLLYKLSGLILILISIFCLMQMFEAYFTSIYYFEYIAKNNYKPKDRYTFSAGRLLNQVNNDNLLTGLLKSSILGKNILNRLGINENEINQLLAKQDEIKNPPVFNFTEIKFLKIADIIDFIYDNHTDFRELLTDHGLDKKDLFGALNWIIYYIENIEYDRRWWTKEKLSKIPGLAEDWSFGKTYLLNANSRDLMNDKEVNSPAIFFATRGRELEQIQNILARDSGANAILVGAPGQEKMEVVWNLCRNIKNKTATPELIGKKVILFSVASFSVDINNKIDFEEKLNLILSETLQAGNIILVIDNFPRLILQAKQYDLNISEIMEPYLNDHDNHIIALTDTEYYHNLIQNNQAIMIQFEAIIIKPLLLNEIVGIIGREALNNEKLYKIKYTYPAILEIAKSAEYYFIDGVSSDKARDLLKEISPWVIKKNIDLVLKENILEYMSTKMNMPIATISSNEKDKLLNLENLMMKRVIAQREAVFVVCNAIRRSRAGIRNENRPLGSFLFIGPTGVGKTETAKALAEIFFTDEKNLMRLDMSEYQTEDALDRLIGSNTNQMQGTLATMLRENPYGVLLLDEFEKTNKKVLSLFLQIIDEGVFTDAFGKKVLAKNIIFIATSNAGAEKIFDLVQKNISLKENEREIIAHIIDKGIFAPELINRFDATVLFHPLNKENLAEISHLMLNKLAKRLAKKGMTLNIDQALITFIAHGGYNPSFGARPMNRLIQNTIEQHLADLIIRQQISAGSKISFKILSDIPDKDSLKPVITN